LHYFAKISFEKQTPFFGWFNSWNNYSTYLHMTFKMLMNTLSNFHFYISWKVYIIQNNFGINQKMKECCYGLKINRTGSRSSSKKIYNAIVYWCLDYQKSICIKFRHFCGFQWDSNKKLTKIILWCCFDCYNLGICFW